MILNGALRQPVQLAGLAVDRDLTIPCGGIECDEPGPKSGQLIGAELFDGLLQLFNL